MTFSQGDQLAKRFTDTEKWKDLWFEELSGISKLFFFYYLDCCDCAGIWKGSFKQFEFFSGFRYSESEMLSAFGDRIIKLENGSYFMPNFIKFQYGTLNKENSAHKGVLKSLNYNNIQTSPLVAPTKPLPSPCQGAKDKDKDKAKDKDKNKDKNKEKGKADKCEDSNIKPIDVFNLWNEMDLGLPKVKVLTEVRKKKLSMFLKEIKNLQDWKDIFLLVPSKGFTGPDGRQFVPSFDFVLEKGRHIKLLEESNADQPIIGKYDNMSSKELWDALEKESINENWEGLENV